MKQPSWEQRGSGGPKGIAKQTPKFKGIYIGAYASVRGNLCLVAEESGMQKILSVS